MVALLLVEAVDVTERPRIFFAPNKLLTKAISESLNSFEEMCENIRLLDCLLLVDDRKNELCVYIEISMKIMSCNPL